MGKDMLYLLVAAGILFVVVGVGFFILQQRASEEEPVQRFVEPIQQDQGLGSELLANPGTLVPETNPFKEVDTNPLQGTNPFEGGYKNPFGE